MGPQLISPSYFLQPLPPSTYHAKSKKQTKKKQHILLKLLHQLTSLVHTLHFGHFFLLSHFYPFKVTGIPSHAPLLSAPLLYIAVLALPLFLKKPIDISFPSPLTGVWAFNIQSMPPSSEASFSTVGFDRQVPPPLPLRPYRSRHMRERQRDAGRRERQSAPSGLRSQSRQTDGRRSTAVGKAGDGDCRMNRKSSLCWGCRGQADGAEAAARGRNRATERLADSCP